MHGDCEVVHASTATLRASYQMAWRRSLHLSTLPIEIVHAPLMLIGSDLIARTWGGQSSARPAREAMITQPVC